MPRPTIAEIDLDAIAHNVREVKKKIGPDVRLLVAVKADGYGHGAVPVAQTAVEHGADYLGVVTAEEGVELRKARVTAPILLFAPVGRDDAGTLISFGITPAITHLDFARTLDRQARQAKKRVRVHVNVDTGMGRVGFQTDEAVDAVCAMNDMRNLMLEGIMTHFPLSDGTDKSFAVEQIGRLKSVLDELRKREIHIRIVHAANSAAVFDMPESYFNMVRLGISLYGYLSSDETSKSIDVRPAMSMRTKIAHLKTVPSGTPVSYGMTFVTERETVVATVPVGYADGLPRELSNRGSMIVRSADGGRSVCPIIGRVCMDMTMLDVTDVPDVTSGSEVIVLSSRRDDPNSVESTARLLGTICHTVTCGVSKRVPRLYLPAQPPGG